MYKNHIKYNSTGLHLEEKEEKEEKGIPIIMNLDSNSLLAVMLASYAIPIWIVWHNYRMSKSTSISQIICRNQTIVIASMAVMAAATCAYEYQRVKHVHPEDVHLHNGGFACIVLLLFCIFSLVAIDETHFAHHVFAVLGFGAIIGFTCVHAILLQTPVCAAVAAVQFAACAHITHRHGSNGDIFWGEVAFIGVFALFYLHLHFWG
jgi:hypothetical protein